MSIPLAERLRPQAFDEIVGQDHLLGEDGIITHIVKSGRPLSLILWGPPGSGKTSIARLYAKAFSLPFHTLSAVFSGIADLRKLVKEAEETPLFHKGIVLFVDEIHRFNKAQQDAFLPFLEKGTITLVGATAENPSFYLNNALLSRMRVLTLKTLDEQALMQILCRYENIYKHPPLSDEIKHYIIDLAQGDGRYLLNLIENIEAIGGEKAPLSLESLRIHLQRRAPLFDKGGDQHYNLISALHKSVRGSDPDASLYWFARMLEGGEDPLFIGRRLIRMASEDIGLADPHALPLALAASQAYQMLGSPEGELCFAEVVIYLALAPKSNSTYQAYNSVRQSARETANLPPPSIILNAPTKLMKELDYGKGYRYDHGEEDAFSGQSYFPPSMERQIYYNPVERGFEREMKKRIDYFKSLRDKKNRGTDRLQ